MNAHYNKVFTTNGKLPECKDTCTQAHSFWRSSKFVFNWELVLYAPSGWRRDSSMACWRPFPVWSGPSLYLYVYHIWGRHWQKAFVKQSCVSWILVSINLDWIVPFSHPSNSNVEELESSTRVNSLWSPRPSILGKRWGNDEVQRSATHKQAKEIFWDSQRLKEFNQILRSWASVFSWCELFPGTSSEF